MIEVTHICKRYGHHTVVDDVTFDVAPGRVTGFVGPNGAGKSTTMRTMVGLTRPDAGEVCYFGTAYTDLPHPARVVGAVLDARSMHPGRTARNHLRAAAALSNISIDQVDRALDTVGLTGAANQRAGGFSLGMRQRLALAVALLGEPDVLLLDEPANGLDPDGIRWLRTYLRSFADQGGTVFVSSHLIAELALFVDDLVVIGGGRILARDPVGAFTAATETTVVAETPQSSELSRLLAAHGVTSEVEADAIRVHGTNRHHVAQVAFDHRIRLDELTEVSATLEDILLDLTATTAEFAAA